MNHLTLISKFKTLIFIGLFVIFCTFSFGQSSNVALGTDAILKSSKVKTISNLRFGAQVGYGYRFAHTPLTNDSTMLSHLNKLKHNVSFGADISYYFTNYLGVGIKYNAIIARVVTDSIFYTFLNSAKKYDYLSELVNVHYFAPFLVAKIFTIPHKQCFFANAGVGYVRYNHKAFLYRSAGILEITEVANIAKNSAAFFAEIGYDFFVNKYFAIGLQTSLLIELKKGKWIEPENISHLDISLGFRFYK
jgi:hypothetical protein